MEAPPTSQSSAIRTVRDSAFNQRLFEYYKECYYFEIEQKDKIAARITWFLALFGLLANICAFYLKHVGSTSGTVSLWAVAFWTILVGGILAGITGIVFFIRYVGLPFKGHSYGWVPTPKQLQDFVEQAEGYNSTAVSSDQIDLNAIFENDLMKQLCDCASANAIRNHKRSSDGYYVNSWGIVAFALLLLASIPFSALQNPLPAQRLGAKVSGLQKTPPMSEENSDEKTQHKKDKESDCAESPSGLSPDPIGLQPSKPQWPPIMWMTEAKESEIRNPTKEGEEDEKGGDNSGE